MNLVIYMEALNSVVIRDEDHELSDKFDNGIAWINDPLGFVHPDGPFFD